MRKVFLDDLPKKDGVGANKDKKIVDWCNSIGYKVRFVYDDIKGWIEIIEYDTKKSHLTVNYLENSNFKIHTGCFTKCALGGLLKTNTKEFKIEIGCPFKDDKRDLVVIDREYRIKTHNNGSKLNQKWYKYTCNTCGWTEGWIIERQLLNGGGCSCCDSRTVVEGINDIPTTAPWMIKYFQGGYNEAKLYTKCSNEKIYPVCPDCGRFRNEKVLLANIYNRHSISCSCEDKTPYTEKFMFATLEQLNLNFKTEYTPKWCKYTDFNDINEIKTGRYDFLLEDYNIIIETDGGWHKKDNNMSGIKKEESKYIDFTKDILALENGYEVIRIDCNESDLEYIKNNISNSKLNEIFDLSIIDWNKCEEFALSNRVKEACEYKKNNPNMTTTEIGSEMKLNRGTITRYLKQGTKLGWCYYDTKRESLKTHIHKKVCKNRKKIINLDTFEIFKTMTDANEKYNACKISEVCKGIRKISGGHRWAYLDEYNLYKTDKYKLSQDRIDYIEGDISSINKVKQIICLENGCIFDSVRQLERDSKNTIGEKLYQVGISQNLKGQRDSYKGYHFMYYNDYLKQQEKQEELNNQYQHNNQSQDNIAI